jgi:hypothetical protein
MVGRCSRERRLICSTGANDEALTGFVVWKPELPIIVIIGAFISIRVGSDKRDYRSSSGHNDRSAADISKYGVLCGSAADTISEVTG